MYVHSKHRTNLRSNPFHERTAFALLPSGPRSRADTQLSRRDSEPVGLQVQGFCCPLQQRPGSGRVTPQSRGGGDGRLILLSGLKGRLESKAKPAARARTGKRAVESPQAGAASVGHHRDQVSHTAENPITPWNNERQACDGRPGAVRVSKLHLYLPSTRCEDLDRDSQTEEIRPSADSPRVQEPDVKPNNTGDQCAVLHSMPQSPSDDITMEDS
ncbi:uncharacterized protein LOC118114550 isoform X2 [Hippoglossus stenolepis]|uniref:uncharacterized protein LOC118114550 isoform X2 n=1 Tax=Hippoglossus stenolepis TaxID=195615 RepID=UPI001FAF441E|nr:uncharacterized protein LOC118114550 isoform X2 [Hippoglossus stenolepis]XP_047197047.1 uncharacterized protein LOC118114550 isoform X2 [Hippoglossus stenolepis]